MMWPLLCLVLVLAPSRTEQQIMDQLVGLESIIRASASTSAQRQEALRKRVEIRGQAISNEDYDRFTRAQWAGDQAEDLLSTGLSLDRLGLQVLYGYPTAAERELAEARISAGLAAVARAEEAVEQAIRDLEGIPASKRTTVQRGMLLQLRERERDLRLPLLRGIGLVHRAECCEAGDARRRTMAEAATALFELDEQLDGLSSVRAGWLRGLALARTDRVDEAATAFQVAATHEDAGPDEVLAARLGSVVNRAHVHGADHGIRSAQLLLRRYEEPEQLREHLLVTDHIGSLHAQLDDPSSAARAWNDMQPLLVKSGVDSATARALIDERIRRLPVHDPIANGSVDVMLAHLDRSNIEPERLIERLRTTLSADDIDDDHRARAMAALGATLVRANKPIDASRVLVELATTMPRRREAGPAIDAAARLALEAALARPEDVAARALAIEAIDVMLTKFPYRPGIDAWRMAAGRLATEEGRWTRALNVYDAVGSDAAEAQSSIRESATVLLLAHRDPTWDAGALDVVAALRSRRGRGDDETRAFIDLVLIEVLLDRDRSSEAAEVIAEVDVATLSSSQRGMLDTFRLRASESDAGEIARAAEAVADRGGADGGAAIALALGQALDSIDAVAAQTGRQPDEDELRAELEPVAEALRRWLEDLRSDDVASWLLVARTYRRSGRYDDALAIADSMVVRSPDDGDVLFERAENLWWLGGEDRLTQAMLIYRRLGRADRSSASRRWWWSQLRMLEILASLERNTEQIAPRIRQLRNDDPTLGGADIRQGFDSLSIRFPG